MKVCLKPDLFCSITIYFLEKSSCWKSAKKSGTFFVLDIRALPRFGTFTSRHIQNPCCITSILCPSSLKISNVSTHFGEPIYGFMIMSRSQLACIAMTMCQNHPSIGKRTIFHKKNSILLLVKNVANSQASSFSYIRQVTVSSF